MPFTGCTLSEILPSHNPNEGRVIINKNFYCILSAVTQAGGSEGAYLPLSGGTMIGNIELTEGYKLGNTSGSLEFIKIPPGGILATNSEPSPHFGASSGVIEPNSTSGSGVGFSGVIMTSNNFTYLTVGPSIGQGYAVGDTITFLGTQFGLSSPADDITWTVTEIDEGFNGLRINSDARVIGKTEVSDKIYGTNGFLNLNDNISGTNAITLLDVPITAPDSSNGLIVAPGLGTILLSTGNAGIQSGGDTNIQSSGDTTIQSGLGTSIQGKQSVNITCDNGNVTIGASNHILIGNGASEIYIDSAVGIGIPNSGFGGGAIGDRNVITNFISGGVISTNTPKGGTIVSSQNSSIDANVTNSVIIGGQGITASTNDSVYVSNLIATGIIRKKGYEVSFLPAGVIGDTAYVIDALSPTYLGEVQGGGLVTTQVFFDGTKWIT